MTRQPREFKSSNCLTAISAIEADLARLATDLTEDQFHAPSRTGGWSVAYCIEHLVLAGRAFLPRWDIAFRDAATRKLYGAGPFPYGWWHRMILSAFEPPHTMKTRTTRQFLPCSRLSIEETTRHFSNMHHELARRIEESVHVLARRARVQSPFVSWIWYPLGFSFDFALTHERRHLWRAWQVRRQFQDAER